MIRAGVYNFLNAAFSCRFKERHRRADVADFARHLPKLYPDAHTPDAPIHPDHGTTFMHRGVVPNICLRDAGTRIRNWIDIHQR